MLSFPAGIALSPAQLRALPLAVKGPRDPAFEGQPVESFHRFFDDNRTFAGVWECTPGRFPVVKQGSSSWMLFLAGAGSIADADGTTHPIAPGAVFVEPDGWQGEWTISETVRKLYVITRTGPTA